MSKKSLFLAISLMLMLATAGCFDLLAIPGVAVSPDGTQVYYLAPLSDKREDLAQLTLYQVAMDGGEPQAITSPQALSSITAFTVNPMNGNVIYMETGEKGTSHLVRYTDRGTQEAVSSESFDTVALGSMLQYSPDGSQIALAVVLLPPNLDTAILDKLSTATPDDLKGVQFRLYLVNDSDGTLTPISDPDKERVNSVAWSPDGKLLAYTTWIDGNDDGVIMTLPNIDSATLATDPGDRSQIRIYDVASGKTTSIESGKLDYSPVFTSDSTLAYATTDVTTIMTGGEQNIMVYDLASGSSQSVYKTSGLITGIALSPDGSQVAWAESGAALPSAGAAPANQVYVAGTDFQNPRSVTELPSEAGIPDIPVWTPDGKAVLMSTTSIISTIMKSALSSTSNTKAEPTPQRLIRVTIEDGSQTTLYEGPMGNGNIFTTIFGLVTSGAMQQFGSFPSQ